jgi:hypothetical protein
MSTRNVDSTIEELDSGMRALRDSLDGIPFRAGGFKSKHDNLARDVAHLAVMLDAARPLFTDKK